MAGTKTIFVATFPEESKTYQAFSEIKALGTSRQIKLEDLAIVRRGADGRLELPDVASTGFGSSMAGGLIGSLIGILGGPLGVLLGWGTGALIGSIRDLNEARSDLTLMRHITENMQPGEVALLGELEEESTAPVNTVVQGLGGELLRRPSEEIERDIETAERARSAAEKEARRVMDERSPDATRDEPLAGIRETFETIKDKVIGDDDDSRGTRGRPGA